MSKQIAIIKDVFRNVPHAVVIKSEDSVTCKSLTVFGQSIIDSCFLNGTIDDEKIPTGFSSTGFHNITPAIEQIIGSSFDGGQKSAIAEEINPPQKLGKSHRFLGRKSISKPKFINTQSIIDSKITKFRTRQTRFAAIDFKASMFRKSINNKIIVSEIKNRSLSFNPVSNTVVGKKSSPGAAVVAEKLASEYGYGTIRRAMKRKTLSKSFAGPRRLSRKTEILIAISREENNENKSSSRFLIAGGI